MSKLKERWEFIVGYIALIVSFSAFKEELSAFTINGGFYSFSASQYLLFLNIGFFIDLHFYLIPYLLSSTRLNGSKLLSNMELLSYFIFSTLAFSPIILLCIYLMNVLYAYFHFFLVGIRSNVHLLNSFTIIMLSVAIFINIIISLRIRRSVYISLRQKLSSDEISLLEISQKLYNDGYYSQSILEAFKVLELHLKKLIAQKDIPVRSNNFLDIFNIVKKLKLIDESDYQKINNMREMRNSAAHLDISHTKQEAENSLFFVKDLIKKTSAGDSSEE